jgi:glycosyltransferase involved in cell wall biosynthesis
MVVSQALQRHYREQYGVETSYVPNGAMLRQRREPRKILDWGLEPGNYILFLGRFSPEKGCHVLVDAYEQLDTSVKLVMAGASSYCDGYSRELRTHGSDRIKILDWVSGDIFEELLTNAMLFVLPSDLEGLSLALLEAMGAGLCVLTSDVPANRELVTGAGFSFKRGDSEDLADKLSFLITYPAAREAAGNAAKARIGERYLWPDIAHEIEGMYLKAMGWRPDVPAPKPAPGTAFTMVEGTETDARKAG